MCETDNSDGETYETLYGIGIELLRPLIIESQPIPQNAIIKGIDYLERALKIAPQSWPSCWALGRAYTFIGELELANRMFQRSFQLNHRDKNVGRELGLSLLRLGYSQLALLVFEKLVNVYPGDHSLIANLGLSEWMSGNAKSGLEYVDLALRLNKNDTSLALRREIMETLERGTPAPLHLKG